MAKVTTTIKLLFVDLNQSKAELFAQMTQENTNLANYLLSIPLSERRKLTTAKVVTHLMSAVANQTIRHTTSNTGKKVKKYKVLPPEINKQNWSVHKIGDTYSLSFPTIKGTKRVPVGVASHHWQLVLDALVRDDKNLEKGSVKIIKHQRLWYAFVSITQEVPEVETTNRVGCDRGQNNLAVVAPSKGFGKFFSGKEVKHRRRYFQKRRESLQKAKKFRALKRWNKKERKWMEAVNHTVSRRIVRFAVVHNADVVIEDLEGCGKTMKQRHELRADAGESRQSWAYYSLEQKLSYKLVQAGLHLVKRPAPYTSKSCSTCGTLGNRHRHDFNCPHGHYHNADLNASRNLAQWDGFSCSLELQKAMSAMDIAASENGSLGTTPNSMNALPLTGQRTRRENPPTLTNEA
ncbi:MAG TPA: transposase [Cyanobacteria bacterium UBA11049]|nr:transposase [Cyanobacteria bacterium UBA11049]